MEKESSINNYLSNLSIGRKIGLGFGILIFLTMINIIVTFYTINDSKKISDSIVETYAPSVERLDDLNLMLVRSKMLITNWVFMQKSPDDPDKVRLRKLMADEYPVLKKDLLELSKKWESYEQLKIDTIFKDFDTLFTYYDEIMLQLNSIESYDDPGLMFLNRIRVEEEDVYLRTKKIGIDLDEMVSSQQSKTQVESQNMINSFDLLLFIVISSGLIFTLGGTAIAAFTIRSIVKPINQFKEALLSMAKGIMPNQTIKGREDEIGEMSNALDLLIDALNRTRKFAEEVGSGNFDYYYEPLSAEDKMGYALLRMRDDLAENERFLEQKVKERTEEVVRQKEEIEEKNTRMAVLYEAITDSIKYAKRIQNSILPPASQINKHLPDSFILYKPKDIVSGDFYWFDYRAGNAYIAAVDCTGHGVPGALMSVVGYNVLNTAMHVVPAKEKAVSPIIDHLNKGVSLALRQGEEGQNSKDGMDVAICKISVKEQKLEYTGAYNPLYIIRNGSKEVEEIKADKFPIGYYAEDKDRKYSNHTVEFQSGDTFYIFSDGYADQFGGPRGKKFMYRRFRELLLSMQDKPLSEHKEILDQSIEDWKGELEQLDDILVIGFRIP